MRFQHLCKRHAKCTMDEATCPTRALKLYGKPMTIEEIVAKALEDKAFYDESGGGVTLSGGEPMFFWEWAAELFKAFKAAGLHTEKKKGSGSHKPGKEKVGTVTRKQVEEIAKTKAEEMTAASIEAAMRTIEGTARSMGLDVVD